jgi:hypothetical protein
MDWLAVGTCFIGFLFGLYIGIEQGIVYGKNKRNADE